MEGFTIGAYKLLIALDKCRSLKDLQRAVGDLKGEMVETYCDKDDEVYINLNAFKPLETAD